MDFLQISTGIIYLILGAGFLLSGLRLISMMKECFPEFYKKTKWQIWTATILLTVTAWIRTLLDIIRYLDASGLDKAIDDSLYHNTWLAPTFDSLLFLLSDLCPIFAQLFSLIFGLIRVKTEGESGPSDHLRQIEYESESNNSSLLERQSSS